MQLTKGDNKLQSDYPKNNLGNSFRSHLQSSKNMVNVQAHASSMSDQKKKRSESKLKSSQSLDDLSTLQTPPSKLWPSKSISDISIKPDCQQMMAKVNSESLEQDIFLEVMKYILQNSMDASLAFNQISIKYFKENEKIATKWIKQQSRFFRLTSTKDGTRMVHICLANFMPCFNYWTKTGCRAAHCKMFHICKKFLFGVDHSPLFCKFNHDLQNLSQSLMATDYNIQSMEPEQLLILLKTRFPLVCAEYLKGNCQHNDLCSKIHICGDFIEGKCKKADGLCHYRHESGLTDKHTVEILKSFHVQKKNYKKCIVYIEDTSQNDPSSEIETQGMNDEILKLFL